MDTKRFLKLSSIVAFIAMILLVQLPVEADEVFFVNTTQDTVDSTPGNGICADASGLCSFRAALMESNSDNDMDTIHLGEATYVLTSQLPEISKPLTIIGGGMQATVIDSSQFRGLYAQSNITLNVSQLTIQNANPYGIYGDRQSILVVDHVWLKLSSYSGLYSRGTSLTVTNSLISNNMVSGIYIDGTAFYMDNTTIQNNSVVRLGWVGGGIRREGSDADFVISNSLISNNEAYVGGGISLTSYTANSQIGIEYTASITNTTISNNRATRGGGISFKNEGTIPVFNNVTITGNEATVFDGGGAEVLTVGGFVGQGGIFSNSIIAGNVGYLGVADDYNGALISAGYNIIGVVTNVAISGDITGNITNVDPILSVLDDTHGTLAVHIPQEGSPALDAGNDLTCETVDQRGLTRPLDGNGDESASCDIGAAERLPADSVDLAVSLASSHVRAARGEAITLVATVLNTGYVDASTIVVDIAIPSGLTVQSSSGDGNFVDGIWTIDAISDGQSATVEIIATVDVNAVGQVLRPSAILNSVQQTQLPTFNDMDVLSIRVEPSDAEITLQTSTDQPNAGDTFNYIATVINNGQYPLTNTVVALSFPDVVAVQSTDGNYVNGLWTVPTVPVNGRVSLTVTMLVEEENPAGTHSATALIQSVDQLDTLPLNDTASVNIVVHSANVSLSINNSDILAYRTMPFNMTFTLRNAGPNTASHLSVPVNLPDFVEVAHSTISRGTYENGVWTIESLANNAQATLTLNLIIAENTTPEIGEGDANVSADQWDSSTLNNNVTFSIEVIHIIDLELTKTVNFLSLYEGDQATYTLTLTNNGIDNATNIQVRDDLPNAVTYVSHVGGGSFDEVTGIWTVSELSAGDSVGLDLVVSVNNETLGQSITNIAEVVSVDQVDIDSTPDNGVVYYEDDIATADFEVCTSTPPVFEISANDVTGISEALQTINNGPCYDGSAVINLTPGGYNISSPYVGASSLGATAFPYIERDVIINGNGATFLRTNPSASYRYFVVQDSGSLTLNDVTIYFAKLSSGSSNYVRGGIVFNSGSVALNRVYVYSASTKGEGGIVYSVGENVEINQSTFEDISGARGAIIYRSTGDATFTNNTIYNVNLSSNGSLFENSTLGSVEDSFTISHNLITDVRGPNGTVLFFARQPIQLRANLVANNNNTTVSLCDGSTNAVSTGYNRFDRASNATCPEINSATDLFSADLVFAPLTYTGGTVVTGNLIPTSTWVDVIPAEECTQITEDQRGFSRPFDSDGDTIAACDIGPLEMRSGNFSISKTVDNATPMADEPYTFTIEVTNTSGMHLPTAFIYDPMNEQMAYVSSSATRGFYLADTGFWGIESFAPDETAVLTLTVVSSATVAPLEMINTAYVVTPFIASEPSASATVNVSCSTFSNWNIPDGDTDALIYAIEMAQNENCNPGANTITLAENGIYEVSTLYDGVNAFPTISSNIVIEGNGSIITRKNSFMRFFNVSDSLTLRDITLEDGYVASFITDNLGGAIYNTGTLLIENSTFDNNRARRGGAIYNNEGTLTIRNSAFLANWAQGNSPVAGAILNLGGTVLIESTDFIENKAHVSNSVVGSGGAIYNGPGLETSGTMTIRDSYFEGNDNIYRGEGGAIANVGSSSLPINTSNWVLVERSQFIENTSISGGGAINNKFGRVVVTESTFLDNNGDGGIYSSGELEVSNSTFSGTTGSNTGIQVAANSTATLEFNTIYSLGQGLYGDGEVIAYANIVDLRTLYTCGNLSITSLGHNIFSNDSCGFDHPNDLNNTDTLVAPLNNYGGNTLTHALLPNSPALDFVTDCHNLSIDQRGYLRPVDGDLVSGSLCDAGAFESQFVPSLGDLVIDLNTEIHIADLGDIVPFNLTLTNNGPDPIAGIAITVESHEGLTYFNHGGDGSFADGIWSIDAIAPNETKTLNFELEVMQLAVSATPHVFAEITGLSDIDPDVSNNVDHVHFYVRGANLFYGTTSISSSTSYATGEVEVYLQLHNGGPDSSSNVSVAIPLPEGLSVISYEGDGTFEDGSWSVGTLDLNEQSEIILVIEIDAGIAEQQLIISAIASSDTGDPVANNVREFTLDIVPASDIAVAITPMTQAVSENEIVNFTVNVTNNGPDVALLTTVALVYPQGLTLIAEDSDGALVGGQWTIAELEVGASAALNMTMQVDAGTDADVSVFEAIANAPLYDFDSSNNRAEFTAFVNPADLAIGINVSQLTPASGDSFTTMITVENATSLDVNNVFVSIALPSQVIYQSASGDGTYNNAVWHIDTIAAGDTATLQLNLLVANNRGGQPFTLSSEIISADRGDNNPDNDYAEESLQVAGADLSITLVPSQDLYQSGDTATFEMTITNNGPFASDAVQAFMGNPIGLPVGLQYVSHQGPGTFTINEEWYWNIDQIEPFTSVTLTINAEIGESMIGQTHHIYSRILQSSEPDSIPENDEALMLVVVDGAKFNLNITRSSGTPQPGERIYLTIIAGNYSDNLVDYAEIQLIVPEGLTYDGHSSSPYTAYDPETGIIALNDFINTLTQRIYFWVDEGTEGQHLEITANVINASVQYIANEASTILSVADAPSEPLIVNTTEDDFDGLCGVIHCSLRDAVYEANQMANGTVTLPAGHYTFTQAQQINITNAVTIEGEDAATTIIDGNNLARIFSVAYGAEFNLSDVTLQNGQVIASASPNTGSALYAASYAEVHLDHVIVQNNVSASEKAAIYTSSLATLDVYDSLVQNHPQRAIETNGTLRISRTTFTNNGTALYTRASYTGVQAGISNSTFSNNTLAIYYESAANSDLFLSYLTLLNNDNAISTNTQIRMRGVVSYGNTNGDIPVTAFSDGYNFIGVLPTNFQNRGDWTTSIIGVDPLLGELQANGGFGPTHEPLPNSPVINVIPYDYEGTSLCGFGGGDQQGSPRPVGPKCDIGAVEYRPGLEVIEPGVLYVSTVEATSDGVLTEGEGVIIDVTQIIVRFTEPMFNPAGDTESADVTNPANYQLIEAGADNIFNSDVCGSLTGDDTASLLNSITYDGDTNQALLSLNGGSPLPIGYYRLGICTSLEDVYGNPLNGDGNINTADVPFVLSFLVDEIQSGPVLTVTFTDDGNDGICGLLHCSLREALNTANTQAGENTIQFNLLGDAPFTIQPRSPLPQITDPVILDGWSQAGFAGVPIIELNGSLAGNNTNGLHITGGGTTIRGFVINRFKRNGIYIRTGGGNTLVGNYIGTNVNGTEALPNGDKGIDLDSPDNVIGGVTPQERNLISGNFSIGMTIVGDNNVIQGNFVGTDVTGTVAVTHVNAVGVVPRGAIVIGANVLIGGTTDVTPDGACTGACNLFSGNRGHGLNVTLTNSIIAGNMVGLDVTGTQVLRNGSVSGANSGIYLGNNDGLLIGGNTPEARNVISGNFTYNISGLNGGGNNVTIQGNYVGTDTTGMISLDNILTGIYLRTTNSLIGGSEPSERNIIVSGIHLNNGTNTVQGNFIGTDVTGLNTLRANMGISSNAQNNIIGGVDAGNVTTGGISLGSASIVQGNYVGVNMNGEALGNPSHGIYISGSDNLIGGMNPGEGNIVSYSAQDGVIVSSTNYSNNNIVGNVIINNGGLGINLQFNTYCTSCVLYDPSDEFGVTRNDPMDADTGGNGVQNYPILTSATLNNGTTTIAGSLNSAANSTYRVDLYANTVCDASGFGEGELYLGSVNVTTDTNGNGSFTGIAANLQQGQYVTVTATGTGLYSGTSEFSRCMLVVDDDSPTAPSELTISSTSVTQIELIWVDNAADESAYHIERSASGSNTWQQIAEVNANSTSYIDNAPLCETSTYRVRAFRETDGRFSLYSSAITAMVPNLCAPVALIADPDEVSIRLDWANKSELATNIEIEFSESGVDDWTLLETLDASSNNFTHANLTCESQFSYRLRAINQAQNLYSDYSPPVTARISNLCQPTNLTVEESGTTLVRLTWDDNSQVETDYVLERSVDNATWTLVAALPVDSTSYTDDSAQCSQSYGYRLLARSKNPIRNSDYDYVSVETDVCPSADLQLTLITSHPEIVVGNEVTFVATIHNAGLAEPEEVTFNFQGLNTTNITMPQNCEISNPTVICSLGAMESNLTSALIVTMITQSVGNVVITGTVSSEISDPNLNNNSVIVETVVLPSQLTQLSPIGTVTDGYGNLTYQWRETNATQYELYVARVDGTQIINPTVSRTDICNGTICSIDLTTLAEANRLTNGAHQWYVREAGGVWVGPMNFTLNAPPPGLVTLGATTGLDNLKPTFNWTLSGNAINTSYFNLYLQTSAGTPMFDQWFTRAEACGAVNGANCSLMSPVELANGMQYQLYIRSYGSGGYSTGGTGGYAGSGAFTINATYPSPISPNGTVNLPLGNPLYTWTDIAGAEYYYLYVANSSGSQIINEVVSDTGYCNGTQCQLDATTLRESYRLPNDAYTFYVRGWKDNQATPWSGGMSFTVNSTLPGAVTKTFPLEGENTDYDMQFQWNEVANVSGYNLYLVDPNGVASGVLRGEVTCSTGTCGWNTTLASVPGTWTWYVQAFNSAGAGAWSTPTTFTAPTAIPDVIAKVAPTANQALTDGTVEFSWTPDGDATQYQLYMTGPSGWVSDVTYVVGSTVTCATNCSVEVVLPYVGDYLWYLRGYSAAGWGKWSAGEAADGYGAQAFSVTDTLPSVVAKIAPTNAQNLDDLTVTFSWTPDAEATYYQSYVLGPNGFVSDRVLMVGVDVTCASTCESTLTLPVNGAYQWYLRGYSAAGWGPWSAGEAADNYGVVNFTVGQPLPGVIAKTGPTASEVVPVADMVFDWTHDANATKYEVSIVGPNGYSSYAPYVVGSGVTCASSCALNIVLPANGAYTWYVRGGNAAGWGPWSAGEAADGYGAVTFTVNQPLPGVIAKISPVASAVVTTLSGTFTWTPDANATKYEVYVAGPNGFVSNAPYVVGSGVTCASECVLDFTFPANGAYMWYVRGGNAAGWGPWSAGEALDGYGGVAFSVAQPLPGAATLLTPANDAVIYQTNRPTFTWNTVATATYYRLYVVNGMGLPAYDQWHTATSVCSSTCSFQLPNPLAFGGYTWQIQTYNITGVGALSSSRSFLSLSFNLQPLMVQVENGAITRTGAWTQQASEGAVGQSYLQSSTNGTDTLTMTFTGTQVDVVYISGVEYGTFVVEIDGEPMRGVNANATQTAFGQIASFTDLTDGEHTLRIIPLGGSPVAIDALIVNGQVLTTQPVETETPIVIPAQPTDDTPIITPQPEVTDEFVIVPVQPEIAPNIEVTDEP